MGPAVYAVGGVGVLLGSMIMPGWGSVIGGLLGSTIGGTYIHNRNRSCKKAVEEYLAS